MKFKGLLSLALFLATLSTLFSQQKIGFDFDYAKFNYDTDSVYLEIYYSFAQNSLTTITSDLNTSISANLNVTLTDENVLNVVDETYTLNSVVDTSSHQFKSEDLIGVLGYRIKCGNYTLKVSAKDNNTEGDLSSKSFEVDLSSLSKKDNDISDIQLCSKIIKEGANPNSIYFKNSLETIPNPKNIYGANLPVLYYYSELYNNMNYNLENAKLKRSIAKNSNLVDSSLSNINIPSGAIVKAGFVNLANYNSGRYNLKLEVLDSIDNIISSSSKDFFVYNPQKFAGNKSSNSRIGYMKSEFGVLNEDECNYDFEIAKYIAAQSEKDLFESLTELDAKRKFLYKFWEKRDIFPATSVNEFREAYMGRLRYVNENYGHRHKKGFKTDRGRIALVYGVPDRVDTRTNDNELKPYEIWSYDSIEGGIIFVFGDTMGISELELLHSTKRGEIADRNWQRRLTIKGGF